MISNKKGFTLIEVMVALAILAALSLLTTQALRSGVKNKARASADISREAKVADAVRIMKADIASAFHYRDIHVAMLNSLNEKTPGPGPTPTPDPRTGQFPPQQTGGLASGTPRPTPKIVTAFVGDKESMYFTALTNVRVMKDSPASDQAKVGYFVKSCKTSLAQNSQPTKCLFRATSPYLDEDVTKIENEQVLLENVDEFELSYFGPEKEEAQETWKTGGLGDTATKDNFPYAVNIKLKMWDHSDKRERPVSIEVLAPIQFPNNPPKGTPQGPGVPNATATATPPSQK
jgi:prepilin-type N-terminal cleavage/methylation domain-containing protein